MLDAGCPWQPIAFTSKVYSNTEASYSITELEWLAVVWSVKLFRPYLYGRSFTIVTDPAALKWLMTRPNLAGRLHRWSLTLQEYEFVIEYRPGAINVVANAVSRAPAVVRMARRCLHEQTAIYVVRARTATEQEGKTEDDDPAEYAARRREEGEEMKEASNSAVQLTPVSEVAPAVDASADNSAAAVDEQESVMNRPCTRGAKKRLEAAATAARRNATETVTDTTRATTPDEQPVTSGVYEGNKNKYVQAGDGRRC
ncbi:unnamed protein product [Phytophthora fragariaefolia]|uniref:Unnamed protein product n=1 Tax=Phytophthora fragariaefolia TaxID=1490495 RepID=A0A9W6Y452_9STRA|nr:unnamed protein product [Phytophthora fragariaefolia]